MCYLVMKRPAVYTPKSFLMGNGNPSVYEGPIREEENLVKLDDLKVIASSLGVDDVWGFIVDMRRGNNEFCWFCDEDGKLRRFTSEEKLNDLENIFIPESVGSDFLESIFSGVRKVFNENENRFCLEFVKKQT